MDRRRLRLDLYGVDRAAVRGRSVIRLDDSTSADDRSCGLCLRYTGDERLTRRERKLASVRDDRQNSRAIALVGLMITGAGLLPLWTVALSLRRGYVDLDDGPELLYLRDDPSGFYTEVALLAGLGLFILALGVRMLLSARRQGRRAANREESLTRMPTR